MKVQHLISAVFLYGIASTTWAQHGTQGTVLYETRQLSNWDEIVNSREWRNYDFHLSLGYSDRTAWLRFKIPDDKDMLVITEPWLDRFDLFFIIDEQVAASYRVGSGEPVAPPIIRHPSYTFPIPANQSSDAWVYIHHIDTRSPIFYPNKFMTWQEIQHDASSRHILHGLYYGCMFIMLLYSFALYVSVRNPALAYFFGYSLCVVVLVTTYDGFGRLYLWPETGWFPLWLPHICIAGAAILLSQFAIKFLSTASAAPRWTLIARIFQLTTLINVIVLLWIPNFINASLEAILIVIGTALWLIISAIRSHQGDRYGRLFLVANSTMMIAGSLVASIYLGWLPVNSWTEHTLLIGSFLEISLLSIVLGTWLRHTHREQLSYREKSNQLAGTIEELREQTRIEKELAAIQSSIQQAQKLKTIGQMSSGIAHDFNNLLATIMGYTDLALDTPSENDLPRRNKYLREVRKAAERGASLLQQLLIFSRSGAKSPKELDLNIELERIAELVRGSLPSTVRIETKLQNVSIMVVVDPALLKQLLINLTLNAAEALHERGEIQIALTDESVDKLTCTSCSTRFTGRYLLIRVSDNGPGIPGNAAELFTPFRTTKPVGQGAGLGLSVVHGISHDHGGHIQLSNRESGGCDARIYLPLPVNENYLANAQKHILLLEDNGKLGEHLKEKLELVGYKVTWHSRVVETMQFLLRESANVDLIITDFLMPDEPGLDLAESMVDLQPSLPIILNKSDATEFNTAALQRFNITAVIDTTRKFDELVETINSLLNNEHSGRRYKIQASR